MFFKQLLQQISFILNKLQSHKISFRRSIGSVKSFISLLLVSALLCPIPTWALTKYLGINNGTGYNTDPTYVDRSILHVKDLGLGVIRMGMDGVAGSTEGAGFDWSARDMVVDKYRAAGMKIHAVLSARMHVERDKNYEQWKANFRHFARSVMTHYHGKIFYYIIDNEPDLDFGNGEMSAQECVDMTQIAYQIAKAIDPQIRIESPPVSGIESSLLDEMLANGIADVSDYIGLHAYGGQISDNRLGHPWRVLARYGVRKPLVISESGSISDYCEGLEYETEDCRRRWFAYFGQQLKRFGYDHALLFDLDGHDSWAVAPNFNPTKTYQQIKDLRLNRTFSNGDFESDNNVEMDWIPFEDSDAWLLKGVSERVSFVRNDNSGAHGGKGYVKLNNGNTAPGQPLSVRRIASKLQRSKKVKIGAWVYVNGGASAALKGLGYDYRNGDAEISASSTKKNGWEHLEIEVPISKNWVVIELGTLGTGNNGDYVKWDDVTINQMV
ncbi:hypothetical protein [Chroococcidiopsis sp [FACHB-1243]]|uniref:hypothetical protein n=1 Tax=Chroococcidiopsis sp. [FACHB-1243] TaxID=2692781 RepID=UPI001F54FE96|nr:hypothetical protein [Chroococcidiopsis sp. [FACHB-1243]]